MKLAVSWFCILHLAAVIISAGVVNREDLKAAHRNLSSSSGRARSPQGAGSLNPNRHRPLFARRGQYERQRIHNPKPKEVPAPPNDLPPPPPPPPKVAAKPVKPSCSELTQSCVPQVGCCDPCASCHCRFFNAICFCRRTQS